MKIKNLILDNDAIFNTFKRFMSFKMSIAVLFTLDPIFEKYVDARNGLHKYKLKAYEKYACPISDVKGKIIRYTVDGASEENKENLNKEIIELLNSESEIGDKLTVDLNRIEGNVTKEELDVLKMFFNFTV